MDFVTLLRTHGTKYSKKICFYPMDYEPALTARLAHLKSEQFMSIYRNKETWFQDNDSSFPRLIDSPLVKELYKTTE